MARRDGGSVEVVPWARRWQVGRGGWQHTVLAGLLFFVAVAATFGGVGLIRDGMGMPAERADRLPGGSWTLAGVALLIGVALPQLAAGWLVASGDRRAAIAALAAGLALVAWIVVQVLVLRRYFFLQPVIAGLGVAEAGLAWWWARSPAAAPVPARPRG